MNSRTYHGEGDHLATLEREAASLKRQPLTLARLADAALPLRDKTGIAGKKKTEQISTLEQEAAGLKRQVHTLARLKSATGPLRPEQAAFIELVAAACGVAFVVRNCADVVRELKL